MRTLLFTVLLMSCTFAQNINTLIHHALKKHPSLQSIQERLKQMDIAIEASQDFANPKLSLTISDIQFGDPFSRDLEPMQYHAVNIQQTFPWFDKLHAKKVYSQRQKNMTLDSYAVAKVSLAKEIRLASYTLKELEERLHILHDYKALVKQNIKLYNAYASTDDKSHSSSMAAALLLARLKIKEERYLAISKTQQAKLKYLTQESVASISNSLSIKKPSSLKSYLKKLKNNPKYQMTKSQIALASANQEIKDLAHTPDPYVKVGYFNRLNFPDYASISVGMALPVYGREAKDSEMARIAVLEASSQSLDYSSSLVSQIKSQYISLQEAYHIYTILEKESLPKLAHMFELSQASIQNGADLFAYTQLLEQKLALEEERIAIQATYMRSKATLNALIGGI